MKLARMKFIATGLLVVMVITYVVARTFEESHIAWPWVRAFAEAGMIGALADWFAVVALFKHPLGLPIPHTAIIKKRKDKIGESLGRFVRSHFLIPEVIEEQVKQSQIVKKAADWLSEEENSEKLVEMVERQLPAFIDSGNYRTNCETFSKALCSKLSTTPIEKMVGKWMVQSMHGNEFRAVMAPLFDKLSTAVSSSKKWVESEAGERAPKSASKLISRITKGVTSAFSGHMVGQLSEQLKEASEDTKHSFYDKLEESLAELGTELHTQGTNTEWTKWREGIFQNLGTQDAVAEFTFQAGQFAVLEKENIKDSLGKVIKKIAVDLNEDPKAIERWEKEFLKFSLKLSDQYGAAFEEMINRRVSEWDANAMSKNIEQNIGSDLQYIRINGSLIGGLIGIVLYSIGLYIWV